MSAELAVEERNFISVEDYLEGEKLSEVRHEYFDGEVMAMAGASDEHELVAGNLFAVLHAYLKGKPCRVFKDGMNCGCDDGPIVLPDVMVACDPSKRYFRERPKLLIEVLSRTNKPGGEVLAYQRILRWKNTSWSAQVRKRRCGFSDAKGLGAGRDAPRGRVHTAVGRAEADCKRGLRELSGQRADAGCGLVWSS